MTPVTVVARIGAKPEAAQKVREELLKLIRPTRETDEGCIHYDLHQDNSNPALFYFLENWASDALLDKHLAQPHLQAFLSATAGLIEKLEVNRLTKIG